VQGYLNVIRVPTSTFVNFALDIVIAFVGLTVLLWFLITQLQRALAKSQDSVAELSEYRATLEVRVAERTASLEASMAEQEQLQQQIIETQQQALKELSTPVIPLINAINGRDGIIMMPLVGRVDTLRARNITRALLAGISRYRAGVVIVDITGVPVVDSDVANHLNKTMQTVRLKGAQTIVTGISDAVAESIVDLGIDWNAMTTLSDLQTGLITALHLLGVELNKA
jgi:rsbT co-antagonist protein RsbR